MEQRQSAKMGETGDARENLLTSGIVWHDSQLAKLRELSGRALNPIRLCGRATGDAEARALVSHHGDPGWIHGGFNPGLSHVGIVLEGAACRRVFSGCRIAIGHSHTHIHRGVQHMELGVYRRLHVVTYVKPLEISSFTMDALAATLTSTFVLRSSSSGIPYHFLVHLNGIFTTSITNPIPDSSYANQRFFIEVSHKHILIDRESRFHESITIVPDTGYVHKLGKSGSSGTTSPGYQIAVQKTFQTTYGKMLPDVGSTKSWYDKFNNTGSVADLPRTGRPPTSAERMEADSVNRTPVSDLATLQQRTSAVIVYIAPVMLANVRTVTEYRPDVLRAANKEIWEVINIEVLRANDGEVRCGAAPDCNGRGERTPEASSGTIPTCKNPGVTPPGIETGSSWWETSALTTIQTRPLPAGFSDVLYKLCQPRPIGTEMRLAGVMSVGEYLKSLQACVHHGVAWALEIFGSSSVQGAHMSAADRYQKDACGRVMRSMKHIAHTAAAPPSVIHGRSFMRGQCSWPQGLINGGRQSSAEVCPAACGSLLPPYTPSPLYTHHYTSLQLRRCIPLPQYPPALRSRKRFRLARGLPTPPWHPLHRPSSTTSSERIFVIHKSCPTAYLPSRNQIDMRHSLGEVRARFTCLRCNVLSPEVACWDTSCNEPSRLTKLLQLGRIVTNHLL
ncbi:hypothetical protein PR048_017860 [Dryococelus australis]|uniref:Uncharacterized protein n=1 Tax=Dryococelus australis TaxID=614101 RepID=A0ABQ9HAS5_9NEOP|nr:hypothetical protein PR048_017860 [Dryococelus australis]